MKKRGLLGVLLLAAVPVIMTLPVSEADAAASASDFSIEGSTLVKYYGEDAAVTVPDSVEYIGESAFEGNTEIARVVLPASVKSIGAYAFWGCRGLTDITIPPETTQIQTTAFYGCESLVIHYEAGSAAERFAQDFYELQGKTAEEPDREAEQDGEAEQTGEAEQDGVTEPDDGIELGSSSVVGNSAFLFLSAEEMEVLESAETEELPVQELPGNTDARFAKYTIVDGRIVADQAYYKDTSLSELYLSAGIEEIGQFAFARSTLTEIELPEGVTDICFGAFYHCDSLEKLTLPSTVVRVEPKAFENTAYLKNFRDGSEKFLINGGVLLAYQGNDSAVSVPSGVRVIAAEVFSGHDELESVSLPDSVTVIGEAAFENCRALKKVKLGNQVEKISDRAFSGCVSLTAIKLPASVQKAGLQAFGKAEVICAGSYPEQSYEFSATRLSNEAYRKPGQEKAKPGVRTAGVAGASAELAGAVRSYTLTITTQEDTAAMEQAWMRATASPVPEKMTVYEMQLTDNSGIPLTRLGGQHALTVTLPVPEELLGQELKLVAQDRNGQIEEVETEVIAMEDGEAVCFTLTYVAPVALYTKE